jgi:hypothetical protein
MTLLSNVSYYYTLLGTFYDDDICLSFYYIFDIISA